MGLENGTDYVDGSIGSFQQQNREKNHWRGSAAPSDIQPGMIFSDSDDDRLYHAGTASALEEILQTTRSRAVTPQFTYLNVKGIDIVCLDNQVVCLANEVVCLATW
jgi:hypothetical protein